ncbi:AMP-binding protein [Streptomyces coffeae]|uniref:AMP-binding protein n=1 Tax=Streptomyces coffeae TaxID=621382 RepID=A0ABS1NEY9_9ACTN|nr:AMP-binding protein [Streptomyces coffeae]MBL1098535.1 AMP-binding protein [Streptomyces coffeae]
MLNLSVLLEDSARSSPDREAVVLSPTRLTYQQVDAAANQVANLLVSRGIKPGDKVALTCPNLPWFPIIYYGILKAGAVVVPLNVLLKAREIAYHLRDSDARAYFCFEGTPGLPTGVEGPAAFERADGCDHFFTVTAEPGSASRVQGAETLSAALAGLEPSHEPVATEATDTAVILYTSGTTGQPKGAELTHANLLLNALTVHRFIGGEGTDRHLVTLPLFHSFGQTVQLHTAFAGGRRSSSEPLGDQTTEGELLAWGKAQFAAYKYPRIVEFRDSLPVSATGKILKRELTA